MAMFLMADIFVNFGPYPYLRNGLC